MDTERNIAGALAEKLSDQKTVEAVNHLLDRLVELHEAKVVDSLLETVQSVTFLKDSVTDTMVAKNASMASDLMEIVSEAAGPELLESIKELKKIHRSGKLKDLFDITDNLSFIVNTITESMMKRNADIMGELYNIAYEAADPSMAEAMRELKDLQQSGNLKKLMEASYMLTFLSNVISDSMVQRIASFMSAFVEEVSGPHIKDMLSSMTKCMCITLQEFAKTPPKPGIKNLLSRMRDPEVQMGMMFMASLAKNMHRCMVDGYCKTS